MSSLSPITDYSLQDNYKFVDLTEEDVPIISTELKCILEECIYLTDNLTLTKDPEQRNILLSRLSFSFQICNMRKSQLEKLAAANSLIKQVEDIPAPKRAASTDIDDRDKKRQRLDDSPASSDEFTTEDPWFCPFETTNSAEIPDLEDPIEALKAYLCRPANSKA